MRFESQHWGSGHGQMLGAQQLVSLAFSVDSKPVSDPMSDSSAIIPVFRHTSAVHDGSEAEANERPFQPQASVWSSSLRTFTLITFGE